MIFDILALFDTSPLTQFSKLNNFFWVCWFLGKNVSNFVYPTWKLDNPYYHNIHKARSCSKDISSCQNVTKTIRIRIFGFFFMKIQSFVINKNLWIFPFSKEIFWQIWDRIVKNTCCENAWEKKKWKCQKHHLIWNRILHSLWCTTKALLKVIKFIEYGYGLYSFDFFIKTSQFFLVKVISIVIF